jgi:hypothetical protein
VVTRSQAARNIGGMSMNRMAGSLTGVLAICLIATGSAPAGEAAKSGAAWPKGQYAQLDRLPDWGGVWVLSMGRAPGGAPAETPQPKGEYLAGYEAYAKDVRENNGVARKENSNCMPPGMPGMMGTGQYPIEFLFTPGRVTTLHEAWMQTRTIFTDGRGHPDDLEPGFFGHSIGHWEGDTLVVDTVGIKTITELSRGIKHSDKLHVTERIHLAKDNPDSLVIEMTMEDPEALAVPYHRTLNFRRERDWNLMEFVCAENDRNPVGADGLTQFK